MVKEEKETRPVTADSRVLLLPLLHATHTMLARCTRKCYVSMPRRGFAEIAGNALERDVVIVGGGPVGLALAGALGAPSATQHVHSLTRKPRQFKRDA